MTNHHCAHACIEQLSTAAVDRVASGFYAAKPEDEIKCPDIEVDQLTGIADVTARVRAATSGKTGAGFSDAFRAVTAQIAKECSEGHAATRCDVIDLYHGGQYQLYSFRRHQDVRLVFAPEFPIAFFGGDPDNFEFPRYDLDVSYLRVYEDGRPLVTDHFFPSAAHDADAGDLTFVSGNPGGTSRLDTLAELVYQRDVALPRALFYLAELRGLLTGFAARGPEQTRIVGNLLFGTENSFKGIKGRFEALVDPALIAAKAKSEAELQAKVSGDPALASEAGLAWGEIAKAVDHQRLIAQRYGWLESRRLALSQLFGDARALVRWADEQGKPNEARLREYTDANFPIIRQSLLSTAPIYPELEKTTLAFSLSKLREALGADDPAVHKILGMKSPEQLATELVDGTRLADPAFRRALFEAGPAAIKASTDPFLVFVRSFDPDARAIRKDFEDNVDSVIDLNAGKIAQARFKLFGTSVYPDATFSARLSFGTVKGFDEAGKPVPPFTTIAGLYERATGADPFKLPESWLAAKASLDPQQKMNFVTTNDIIGGNSGSPVINRQAQIVGLIFDGNIHSLGGEYGFDPVSNRAVAVNIGALRMALDKVYHADRLVAELRPPS